MNYSSIPKLFAEANMYIQNASTQPEIQKKLNLQGFTPKRMQEGATFLAHAMLSHTHKTEKYGEKKSVSSQVKTHEEQARQRFMEHVAIVKFVFRKDAAMLSQFNVDRVSKKVHEWILQASYFYLKSGEHKEVLAQHSLTAEEMAQAMAMVEAVSTARNQRMLRKGEAEDATRTRDLSLKALKKWMKDFRAIARVALRDNPQLMESLGIMVKSQKV